MQIHENRVYNLTEVAEILGVSTLTVRRVMGRGELNKISGLTKVRFSGRKIIEYINKKARK